MAITHCMNPSAGGYNPNSYTNSDEATAAHIAEAHVVTYVGAVLALGEHNYAEDSDFFALVWSEDQQAVIEVGTGTTRSWTYHDGGKVDATDEVKAKAIAWKAEQLAKELIAKDRENAAKEAARIDKGDVVRSLTTRGKNKGVEGEVTWVGKDQYKSTRERTVLRFGIQVGSQTRYLSEDSVELVTPRPVAELDDEDRQFYQDRALARAREMYKG